MKKRKVLLTVIFGLIVSQLITWGAYSYLAATMLPTHFTAVEPLCTGTPFTMTDGCNTALSVPFHHSLSAYLLVIASAEVTGFIGMGFLASALTMVFAIGRRTNDPESPEKE